MGYHPISLRCVFVILLLSCCCPEATSSGFYMFLPISCRCPPGCVIGSPSSYEYRVRDIYLLAGTMIQTRSYMYLVHCSLEPRVSPFCANICLPPLLPLPHRVRPHQREQAAVELTGFPDFGRL